MGLSSWTFSLASMGLAEICSVNKALFVFIDLRTRQSAVLWEEVLWNVHQQVLAVGFWGRGLVNRAEVLLVDG